MRPLLPQSIISSRILKRIINNIAIEISKKCKKKMIPPFFVLKGQVLIILGKDWDFCSFLKVL